jgi:hypothetical protein
LTRKGDATERTVGGDGARLDGSHHGVERRVDGIDARQSHLDELVRGDLAAPDQPGLGGGVERVVLAGPARGGAGAGMPHGLAT